MSNREHSSQLGRTTDVKKNRLVENATTSDKKKRQIKKRPKFDKYKKSALDLTPKGCHGCNRTTCRSYVEGLEKLKEGRDKYGCHS